MLKRKQINITGCVQGVGFRPYVYKIATRLGTTGWIQNNGAGITIEVQSDSNTLKQFLNQLPSDLPPLAKINSLHIQSMIAKTDEETFSILPSKTDPMNTILSPDIRVCDDCINDLFTHSNRFYAYPFLSCVHCGPRFSITYQLPFDRDNTSMQDFPMCLACDNDYKNSLDRRHHAQLIACSHCGPRLATSISEIAEHILHGKIIALKGIGGYQLICDASNEMAISQLREKKLRQSKPLAIMVLNVLSASAIAELNDVEEKLLTSQERPIVLLKQKPNTLPPIIAPELSNMGIMLPYTPLHYLLFHALIGHPKGYNWLYQKQNIALIVTSANTQGTPITIEDNHTDLSTLADQAVSYNREIVARVDDSVVREINRAPCFIRRARGFIPKSIPLPHSIPPTLALGGFLKNTFCITRDNEAFLSPHIGNLTTKATRDAFHEMQHHLLTFLNVKPECIAHDMHPDYYTTQLAQHYNIPTFPIQHHHAHLMAVAAEYHIQEPALGLALDGHGYGTDSTAWGGELFLLESIHAQRLAHLQPLPLPGGEKAATEPWRMGASILHQLNQHQEITQRFSNQPEATLLSHYLKTTHNIPMTSSCGRLFDAAASLLGVHTDRQYEGQAAMKLESLVTKTQVLPGGWKNTDKGLSFLPLFNQLITLDSTTGANLFHGTLIAAFTELVVAHAEKLQINIILLSGGCFLNKILCEGMISNLQKAGLRPLLPQQAPPNDGGISLGQAWLAGQMICV